MAFSICRRKCSTRACPLAKGAVSAWRWSSSQRTVRADVRRRLAAGLHERNGGNVSYRMTPEDIQSSKGFFLRHAVELVALPSALPQSGGR